MVGILGQNTIAISSHEDLTEALLLPRETLPGALLYPPDTAAPSLILLLVVKVMSTISLLHVASGFRILVLLVLPQQEAQ